MSAYEFKREVARLTRLVVDQRKDLATLRQELIRVYMELQQMDVSDQATRREEINLQDALAARRPAGPEYTGECHACGVPVPTDGMRWCDAACRDDWERGARP